MATTCVDLSYVNTVSDWSALARVVDLVILRCGYGRESNQKDANFESFYKAATGVGLPVAVYQYSYAKTQAQVKQEAACCLEWIKGKDIKAVFYDIEEEKYQGGLTTAERTALCTTFCDTIAARGYRVGVYANKYWWTSKLNYDIVAKNRLVWVAQYNSTCTLDKPYDIWQYTEYGTVAGVKGRCDVNHVYTDFIGKESEDKSMDKLTGIQTLSKKTYGATKITDNFKVSEFACNDGSDKILIDLDGVRKLQTVRDLFGKVISITSAYRTATYNKKVGGASNSYHIKGQAFDTVVSGVRLSLFAKAYEVAGMGCTIIYDENDFVHTDTRSNQYYAYSTGASMTTNLQTCKQGGTNSRHIMDLQLALNLFAGAKLTVDGKFGSGTLAAVKTYQKSAGLTADGICGKLTWTSLLTK